MKTIFLVTSSASCMFFHDSLGYLRDRGFEIQLISSPGKALLDIAKRENVVPVEIPMEREIAPFADVVSLWKIYRHLSKTRPVIVNASTAKAALLGNLAAWLARVPIRVLLHRGLRMETTSGWKRFVLWWCDKVTCRCATRILCISESLRKQILRLNLAPPEKLTVLESGSSNGLDSQRFSISEDTIREAINLRKKYAIPPKAPVLGYIGRIVHDKGIVELAEVLRKVSHFRPDARLILVGPEETGDPVDKKTLQFLKESPNVILTGLCHHVIPFYLLFDVFVFPSYREGFGNVILEAASMGVPTVGFHTTGVVDAVSDGETGTIVAMKDTQAMADAVIKYLTDPALRFKHGLNGRRRVVRDFHPQALWEAYYQEYCALIRQKNFPIPVPELVPEQPFVNPQEDDKEFQKWFTVGSILCKNANINEICGYFQVDIGEIRKVLNVVSRAGSS